MRELGDSMHQAFEARLLQHIEEYFPVHWREAGPEHLREVIRLGITNAASYGLETQREIYLFVSLMLYLGSQFDTDYQLPWVQAALLDKSETDAFTRVETTYNLTLEYLERVAGPNGQYEAPAVERFTKVAEDLGRASSAPLAQALAWIYPKKVRELNEAQMARLAQQGWKRAQIYNLDEQRGVLLCAGLALLLGHGFAEDPQFSWASEVLTNPEISNPGQRVTVLKDASVLHLRQWFAGTGAK